MNVQLIIDLSLATLALTVGGLLAAVPMWWSAYLHDRKRWLEPIPLQIMSRVRRRTAFIRMVIQAYLAFESVLTCYSLLDPDAVAIMQMLNPALLRTMWLRITLRLLISGMVSWASVNSWHDRKRLETLL